MNDSGSCELKPLDAKYSLWAWMIRSIRGREPMALDDMNISWLWMIYTTLGHEIKALDAMNNLKL